MKRATSILAIAVAAFVMGCQDTLTDPTSSMPSSKGRVPENVPEKTIAPVNTLSLNAVLHAPGNVYNSFLVIAGAAAYQATVVPLDPIPPNPQYAVSVNLTVNAEVRPYGLNEPVWHVSGTSDNWVPIPESGTAFLTKRYPIEGGNDGMSLNVRFRITLDGIELNSMSLELPRAGHGSLID